MRADLVGLGLAITLLSTSACPWGGHHRCIESNCDQLHKARSVSPELRLVGSTVIIMARMVARPLIRSSLKLFSGSSCIFAALGKTANCS